MFDKIKMRRGRQWYVNKGNEWFFDEKHDKMNGKQNRYSEVDKNEQISIKNMRN